jgi:hypothetical protein
MGIQGMFVTGKRTKEPRLAAATDSQTTRLYSLGKNHITHGKSTQET